MPSENTKAEFDEIGRVKVSPTTDVVLSTVCKDGNIVGINVNTFVSMNRYTGYTRGVFIPNDKIGDFAKLINGI
jgi:hypothetical protein